MTTDEHPYLEKFRIWPDETIQRVEGDEPPFGYMSDDFVTILARTEEHAFAIFDALNSGDLRKEFEHLNSGGLRKEFEHLAYQHYLDRKVAGKLDPPAEGDGTPEALFWKQEDGSYGVLMFNAAWQGFKWGRGLV